MRIAVDFDGTVVTHEYPKVGKDVGAVPVLKKIIENGHKIVLNTMRSHKLTSAGKDTLKEAEEWFKKNGIELYGVNENPEQKSWTDSPKPYANLYIDDSALGCPLKIDKELSTRPFVDWEVIENWSKTVGLI